MKGKYKMSQEFKIQLDGEEQLLLVLQELGQPRNIFRRALSLAGERLKTEAKEYPPKLSNQVYERTFKLRQHWAYRVVPSVLGVTLQLGNNISYAPKVMDAGEQDWIHRGRWNTIQDILASNTDMVVDEVTQAIQQVLNSAGKK